MTTNHSTQESATFAQERAAGTVDRKLADVLSAVMDLLYAVQVVDADKEIDQAQPVLWQAAWDLLGEERESKDAIRQQVRAQGAFLALRAIAETPGTLERMLARLQAAVTGAITPAVAALATKRAADAQARPGRLKQSTVFLSDLMVWAEGVTAGITSVIDNALLSREGHFLWETSADILNRHARPDDLDDTPYQRLSTVLLLEALMTSPAAVQNALKMLRSLLLEEDPKVAELRAALEGRNTPPA